MLTGHVVVAATGSSAKHCDRLVGAVDARHSGYWVVDGAGVPYQLGKFHLPTFESRRLDEPPQGFQSDLGDALLGQMPPPAHRISFSCDQLFESQVIRWTRLIILVRIGVTLLALEPPPVHWISSSCDQLHYTKSPSSWCLDGPLCEFRFCPRCVMLG